MAASDQISDNPSPASGTARPSAANKRGRGGRRPGAGAPRGNMNALKHGSYSRQFARVGALLAADPRVRETLLSLGRRHNLQRQKANEVAALLLTRLFQRAEGIASGNPSPSPAHGRGGQGVRASVHSPSPAHGRGGQGVREGLNLDLPADDRDSITIAAAQAARRQLRSNIRRALKNRKTAGVNQTPDTTAPGQSTA